MLPLLNDELTMGKSAGTAGVSVEVGDMIVLPGVRAAVESAAKEIGGYIWKRDGSLTPVTFTTGDLTDDERKIILAGSLVGYYKNS